jgi:hypothetical protein
MAFIVFSSGRGGFDSFETLTMAGNGTSAQMHFRQTNVLKPGGRNQNQFNIMIIW